MLEYSLSTKELVSEEKFFGFEKIDAREVAAPHSYRPHPGS